MTWTFDVNPEIGILNRAASFTLVLIENEEDILKRNPANKIAQYRINKYKTEYNEIRNRIIELEKAEKA